MERAPARSRAGGRLQVEDGACRPRLQQPVLPLGYAGNREDPPLQAVEVNLYGHRLGRRLLRTACWLVRRRFLPLGSRRLRRHRLHALVLVALGEQGARLALLQHRQVEPEGLLAVVRGHVEPLGTQAEVGGREEPQVLAAGVPHGVHRVREAVGHLFRLAGLHVAHEDRPVERAEAAGIRHPPRVGAPRRVERALRDHPGVAADDPGLAGLGIEDPDVELRVGEQELLRVRRPRGRVVERRVLEGDLAWRRQAVLRLDHQRVLAGPVTEVRDVLAVGGPGRLALGRRARVGQVPDVALLRGHRENLAAGLHHDPLAGRRQAHVGHPVGDVSPPRHHPREIPGDGDLEDARLARLGVELVDEAALLEDHDARARVEGLHVEVAELRELRELLRLRLVGPDVRDAVPVGNEDHRLAQPGGVHVLGVGPRGRHEVVAPEVHDPDGPVLAAPVVAAFLVPGAVHPVGDVAAVGRDPALVAARQGKRLLHAPLGGHGPEPRRAARRPGGARRGEEDPLAVGRPPLHRVSARVPREPPRLAAERGDDVDVGVPGVLGAEGHPLPVRREARVRGLPLEAGQAARGAARPFDHPDVVRVGEGDVPGAHGGRTQQARRRSVRGGEGRQEQQAATEQGAGLRRQHGDPPGDGSGPHSTATAGLKACPTGLACCTLHLFCILHSAFCVLHSALCILHFAFCIPRAVA